MKKLTIIFAILMSYVANSQFLSLFDIDTSNFPTIKAKFFAFDAQGDQITNLSPSDFELKENGIQRNVTLVSCPTPKPPEALSSVLVIDASGSMLSGNLDLAKEAARVWVKTLPLGKSECAITSFNSANYLNQDFTTDRNKLLAAINNLQAYGGTDYDAALINPVAGGLLIIKNAKYKRVIVFLSDGMPNFEPQTSKIIQEANMQNVTIYGVTLGMPCPQSIKDITTQTGGQWFENVTTEEQASQIYLKILQIAQGGEPCTIEWQSISFCTGSLLINVGLKLLQNGTTSTTIYQLPLTVTVSLEFSPSSYRFKNPPIGTPITKEITVTARNTTFTVSNTISSNPAFTLTPTSFTLQPNESKKLALTYTAIDSGYTFVKFTFVNDICDQFFFASGGYRTKKPKTPNIETYTPERRRSICSRKRYGNHVGRNTQRGTSYVGI